MMMVKVKTGKTILSGEVETGTAYNEECGMRYGAVITYWHDIDVYQ